MVDLIKISQKYFSKSADGNKKCYMGIRFDGEIFAGETEGDRGKNGENFPKTGHVQM